MTSLDNPYFEEVAGGVTVGSCRGCYSDRAVEVLRRRDELVKEYAWAIPNTEAIETIVHHEPILEVGAGNGYWAWLVEQAGGDIVATDPLRDVDGEPDPWTDVEQLSYRPAIEHRGAGYTLLICWPNLGDRWAHNALRCHADFGGRRFIYVGEGRGGCTADESFHELLFDEWILGDVVEIPTYLGRNGRLEVWTR